MDQDPRDPLLDPEEDPRVLDALAAIEHALTVPADDLTVQRHRRAIAAAVRTSPVVAVRRAGLSWAAAAALVAVLAVGGLLPGPAQEVAADVASRFGFELPRPAGDEVPPDRPVDVTADTTTDDAERAEEPAPPAEGQRPDPLPTTPPAGELVPDERPGRDVGSPRATTPSPTPDPLPTPPAAPRDRAPQDPPADAPNGPPADGDRPGATPSPTPSPTPAPPGPPSSAPTPDDTPTPGDRPGDGEADAAGAGTGSGAEDPPPPPRRR
jgi:hypothetical protein